MIFLLSQLEMKLTVCELPVQLLLAASQSNKRVIFMMTIDDDDDDSKQPFKNTN